LSKLASFWHSARHMQHNISRHSLGEHCEQMMGSFLSEVKDATRKFRVDQEKQLQRFDTHMENLMLSTEKAFAEKFGFGFNGQGMQDERTLTPQEMELTPMSNKTFGDNVFGTATTRSTLDGPTNEQLARMYHLPKSTRSFYSRRRLVASGRSQTSCVATFVRSRRFAFAASSLIILNALFIGVTSNWMIVNTIEAYHSHHGEHNLRLDVGTPRWASITEVSFSIAFAVELFLRILADEMAFFCGGDLGWNMLDILLVTASLTELMIAGMDEGSVSSIRLLRLLRLLRTFRSVRILRFLGFFSKFRLLALAIQNSVMPFVWALSMVFWGLYLVSVLFLHGVADYVSSGKAHPSHVAELETCFGSLGGSLLTLFMSITGGMDWNIPLQALFHLHTIYGLVLILFVAAMSLAALNIIAGIFVNDAIEMAQMDREIALQAEAGKNKALINELSMLFTDFDTEGTGTLTLAQLTRAWNDPEVSARFRMLGVEEMDAAALFRTLDVDGSEQLDVKEFVTGCLRAKTLTKPVDFPTFMRELKRTSRSHKEQLQHITMKLDRLLMEDRSSEKHITSVRPDWNWDEPVATSPVYSRLADPRGVRLNLSFDVDAGTESAAVSPDVDDFCSLTVRPRLASPLLRSPSVKSPLHQLRASHAQHQTHFGLMAE